MQVICDKSTCIYHEWYSDRKIRLLIKSGVCNAGGTVILGTDEKDIEKGIQDKLICSLYQRREG